MKRWYHSKTVWFNAIMTMVHIAAYFQSAQLFGQSVIPFFVAIQGIGNILLRVWFTKRPLGKLKSLDDYVAQEAKEPSSINHHTKTFDVKMDKEERVPFSSVDGFTIENHAIKEFFKDSTGTVMVALKNNSVPVPGAQVIADYYKPNNESFLHNQSFSEINSTGMYYHTFPILPDAEEGVYRVIIQAAKKIGGANFADSFSGVNGPAPNWRVISGSWTAQNNIYRQTREDFINSSVVSFPEALEWNDYSYEADVKWDSNKSGQLGILGRWLGPTVFYCLYFDPELNGGKLVLRRADNILQIVDYPLVYPSVFIKLKMVFSGNNIKCYVDDTLRIDFNDIDGAAIKKGTAGLYTQHISASFNNVSVMLKGEQLSASLITNFNIQSSSTVRAWNWETAN